MFETLVIESGNPRYSASTQPLFHIRTSAVWFEVSFSRESLRNRKIMSNNEYDSYSEEEEITDLSNPNVVEKYKVAADIVNKALKGVLSQVWLPE